MKTVFTNLYWLGFNNILKTMAFYTSSAQESNGESTNSDGCTIDCGCSNGFKDFLYRWRIIIGILLAIGGLLILILLPLSFSYVERGQVGLRATRVSGDVDQDGPVYIMDENHNGRYHLGPGSTIETFDNLIQQDSQVLNAIASNSRGFKLHVISFYRIIEPELGNLFQKFNQNWKVAAVNEVVSTLKSVAPQYDIDDYVENIETIRVAMENSIRAELRANHLKVIPNGFIIIRVDFQGDIDDQYLRNVIQEQTNEERLIQREVDLILQDTETRKQEILANQTRVKETGAAQAKNIVVEAQAEADKIRGLANTEGFTHLFNHFNVTDPSTRTDFLEYYALENNIENIQLLIGVDNAIVQLVHGG